ncbi:MAG TPA: efflux transporter outer membrane subunit [Bacteroidia bacterium]|nr:efflux transporter outer membrane subunit [Bacteroidia bacterium]
MKRNWIKYALLVLLLNACMVGPDYKRPAKSKAPAGWNTTADFINTADTITNLRWFNLFQDTVLKALIDTAIHHNYNLANATLRIEQSRANFSNSKADLLPQFSYYARARNRDPQLNQFNTLGIASWEIDIWGKLRRAKKAAFAQMLASQEGMKTILTTLISDVASYYFLMRDYDYRLAVSQRIVKSRQEYYELIRARFQGGDVSELDVLQADQQLSLAKATVQTIKRQLNLTERSLNILLGQAPQTVARGFENAAQPEFPVIPSGLPSAILENRPDVRQAEFLLQAESERIGVAIGQRLPTFNLTGILGLASAELSTFASVDALTSSASATLLGPIFNFGKNKRRVTIQRQETEIAANRFLNVYIAALGEVEGSLVSVQTLREEYEARKHQAEVANKSLTLSKERYTNGYTNYLEVLVAEGIVLDSELQASATKGQQLSAYIQLYRALGGGW